MRSVSSAFLRALSAGRSDYALKAVITLTDSTTLTLENEEIWDGGFSVEDAVSNDNSFDVGAAIINQAKLVINNIYEDYDAYDFDGVQVVMYAGFKNLDDGTSPYLRMGTFTVDETSYDGSIITLTCLDNMSKFDKPYDTNLVYPATLGEIVRDACSKCGVTLANNSQQFNRYTYTVDTKPDGESTTYRQVISWAAQIAGSFARCNANGQLEIKWYNVSAIDSDDDDLDGGTFDNGSPQYSSGDTADGGTFNPWNTGYVYDAGEFSTTRTVHYITSDYSSKISTDNVVITGVKVRKKLKDDTSGDGYVEYTSGTAGYMVGIEDNDLIQGTHGQDIADALGLELIGLSFRKADITHPSDPTIEAGDVAFFWDRKGRKYPIIISSTTFTAGNSQHTTSSAETPKKNSMQRFTAETQNYVDFRKQLSVQKTAWQSAVSDLAAALAASGGLYCDEVPQPGGGSKIYYHNKPSLAESDILMLFTDVGFTLSNDGGETWYGMTVDGTMIASILNTIGVNADWINSGSISIKDANDVETFYADTTTGVVRIKANSFSLSDGTTFSDRNRTFTSQPTPPYAVGDLWFNSNTSDIMTCVNARSTGSYTASDWQKRNKYIDTSTVNTAVSNYDTSLNQTAVFNKLTNNGAAQGIYLQNGQLYISFTYAKGGTLTLGGSNNTNGSLRVLNASGTQIGKWDKDGIDATGAFTLKHDVSSELTVTGRIGSFKVPIPNYSPAKTGHGLSIFNGGSDNTNLHMATYVEGISQNYVYLTSNKGMRLYSRITVPASDTPTTGGVLELDSSGGSIKYKYGSSVGVFVNSSTVELNAGGNGSLTLNTSGVSIPGNLSVSGTKNRRVATPDYSDRLLYCYETPSPLFGDVGEGEIADDGKCYVYLDAIFAETINTNQYQVFLQKYGSGDCWVAERKPSYFVVEGTPGISFGWELKAKQLDFDQKRLDMDIEPVENEEETNYGLQASLHLSDLRKEREGTEE